jgi:hypothetical protein
MLQDTVAINQSALQNILEIVKFFVNCIAVYAVTLILIFRVGRRNFAGVYEIDGLL